MKVLINFADEKFKKQQAFNTKTGYKYGKFDKVIEYTPADIDAAFLEKNSNIFSIERGYGLWLWKPYFITKTLNSLNDGDYLFYCDAGAYFMKPIDELIRVLERDEQDVMCFEIPLLEYHWTSQECFNIIGCYDDSYAYSSQRLGGFILMKNTEYSRHISNEFLRICENITALQGGELGKNCISHREDQSIWSLLTKKYRIPAYRDPSQYGEFPEQLIRYEKHRTGSALVQFSTHNESSYPSILYLYRKEQEYKFLVRLKSKLRLARNRYFKSKL